MNRKYELRKRASRQAQTRERIVEAAVELHTSVGPARTTIKGIAERAGVERHTVYAHFPDELSLFRACSQHWTERHPLPEVAPLAAIADPVLRLRRVLDELYEWYDAVEPDVALFVRDVAAVPPEITAGRTAHIAALVEAASRGWPRRKGVRAAIGHALEFETWRSLVRRQGLSRTQAVDMMARLVSSL
jgi:AcrR family transcriptional regulator